MGYSLNEQRERILAFLKTQSSVKLKLNETSPMGLKDSKAVFLQLQIKDKEVEGKQKSNKLTIQALTFWFL